MNARYFRAEATRALSAGAMIGGLTFGTAIVAAWLGSGALRSIAETVAHACIRLWAALPVVLRVGLAVSATAGVLCGVLWLYSVINQWRATRGTIRSLRRAAVILPPRLESLFRKYQLGQQVTVFEETRPAAFTAGLIAPRIFVSTGLLQLLDEDELEAVLLHERSHLRHKDPAYLLLGRALSVACPFAPAVRELARRHQAAVELAADEEVAATQGQTLGLSSAILKLFRVQSPYLAVSPFTPVGDLRLTRLLDGEVRLPPLSWRGQLQTAAAIGLLAFPSILTYAFAVAVQQASFLLRCPV